MPPESTLSLIERYGSFGLLAALAVWVCAWVVPNAFRSLREIVESFSKDLKAERESRERDHKICEENARQTAEILTKLIDRMEDRSNNYHGRPHDTQP